MDSATAAPSAPPVTSGQSINVVSWILLCIMLLSVATRLGTKFTIIHKLEADDGVACLAMVGAPLTASRSLQLTDPIQLFSSAQTITLSTEVANGLGRHYDDLDISEQLGFQKACLSQRVIENLRMSNQSSHHMLQTSCSLLPSGLLRPPLLSKSDSLLQSLGNCISP